LQVHATRSGEAAQCRSSSHVALMFFVRQTSSKSAEINHEGHEGHKEFATARVTRRTSKIEAIGIGLISARLFTCIVSCLRQLTEHRGARLVKALKPVQLHLPPRIGAWCWQRKANQRRLRRRWRSSAERTGGHFTASPDAKAINRRMRRISLKLFLRGCSNGGTSKL